MSMVSDNSYGVHAKLGDLVRNIIGGGTPSRIIPKYWGGDIPWASVKDFDDEHFFIEDTQEKITELGLMSSAANLIPAGIPILCARMAVGRCGRMKRPTAINQDLKALFPNKDIDSHYLLWLLKHSASSLQKQGTGSTVSGVSISQIVSLPLYKIRSIKSQRTIATVLNTVDVAIRRTEALIEKLRRVKAGMLHDLLTCGLDENGELRDPIRHPEQFKNSPLGRIPKNWEILPLGNVADFITSGSRGWAHFYAKDGPLFLRIGNLTREHINLRFDDVVHVQPPRGTEGARTKVMAGDLLLSITADLGIVGCASEAIGEAYVNQHIALVRIKRDINSRWIAHYLACPLYQHNFQLLNDGGAKAGMNLTSVGNLAVAFPCMETEQHRIVQAVDEVDGQIKNFQEHLRKLLLVKQGLMQDLLSGRVRITNPQEIAA
jgi:type I restriction enzyme, S subunit